VRIGFGNAARPDAIDGLTVDFGLVYCERGRAQTPAVFAPEVGEFGLRLGLGGDGRAWYSSFFAPRSSLPVLGLEISKMTTGSCARVAFSGMGEQMMKASG
jgi:hypothetical protein